MPKDTSIEIPQSLEDWVHQWLFDKVESGPMDLDTHVRVTTFCRAISYDLYRHLSAPLSSPSIEGPFHKVYVECPADEENDYTMTIRKDGDIRIKEIEGPAFIHTASPSASIQEAPTVEADAWRSVFHSKPDSYRVRFKDKYGKEYVGNYSEIGRDYYSYGVNDPIPDVTHWKPIGAYVGAPPAVEEKSDELMTAVDREQSYVSDINVGDMTQPDVNQGQGEEKTAVEEVPGEMIAWINEMSNKMQGKNGINVACISCYRHGCQDGAIALYRYVLGKDGNIDAFKEGYKKAVATINPELISRDNEIASLRSKLEAKTKESENWRDGYFDHSKRYGILQAECDEIELLRKNGAGLRHTFDLLPDGEKAGPAGKVLLKCLEHLYQGFNIKMLGEHEERVSQFLLLLQQALRKVDGRVAAAKKAHAIAFGVYLNNLEFVVSSMHDLYCGFLADDAKKNENHKL